MLNIVQSFRRTARKIGSDESGAMTVESVLWMPFYMMFFALIADASLMFHSHSQATRIVHDANRLASYGTYTTPQEMKAAVKARLDAFSPNATITSVFGPTGVATTVTMPVSDIAVVGIVKPLMRGDITVSLLHLVET
jgi:Flp pilus assembly protein TadG